MRRKVTSAKPRTEEKCESETPLLMFKRWKKIEEDMVKQKREDGSCLYDMSKLPEICDNIVYDMIHYEQCRTDEKRVRLLKLA